MPGNSKEVPRYSRNRYGGIRWQWFGRIDNNAVERAIRPIAIERKNYLFAGSHEAAQRAAMIYSLFSTCKLHNINPYNWLKCIRKNAYLYNNKS
jgi:transposase